MRHMLPLLAALLMAAAACGGDPTPAGAPDSPGDEDGVPEDPLTDDPPDDTTRNDGSDESPRPDDDAPLDPDGPLAAAIEVALADAAAEARVDPGEVELVDVEEVTWSDGSLGCPQPDAMYTQALVDGYRIVVAVAGEEIAYHGARDGEPFRCDDPRPPASGR